MLEIGDIETVQSFVDVVKKAKEMIVYKFKIVKHLFIESIRLIKIFGKTGNFIKVL